MAQLKDFKKIMFCIIIMLLVFGIIRYRKLFIFVDLPFTNPYSYREIYIISSRQINNIETIIVPIGLRTLGGVVQGRVVESRTERLLSGSHIGGRGPRRNHLYNIYTIEVLGVYRGGYEIGSRVDLVQLKNTNGVLLRNLICII